MFCFRENFHFSIYDTYEADYYLFFIFFVQIQTISSSLRRDGLRAFLPLKWYKDCLFFFVKGKIVVNYFLTSFFFMVLPIAELKKIIKNVQHIKSKQNFVVISSFFCLSPATTSATHTHTTFKTPKKNISCRFSKFFHPFKISHNLMEGLFRQKIFNFITFSSVKKAEVFFSHKLCCQVSIEKVDGMARYFTSI